MIRIEKTEIGQFENKTIVLFRLTNSSGSYTEIINYGATLVSVVVPDKNEVLGNCILSYKPIEDYFSDQFYLGSTVGRFANRISKAQFELNGKIWNLDKNDGENCNHGGFNGLHKQIFDYKIQEDSVSFFLECFEDNDGFPGNLQLSVHYSFSENNELTITYKGASDKDTIFNPTNHAYFNLSDSENDILNHELRVYSDRYLESNQEFLPTGRIIDLADTVCDFRDYRSIAHFMPLENNVIPGYNTYFVGNGEHNELKKLASLIENQSGRQVDIYSTMPGIQLYTGDYLSEPFFPYAGVALEAQFYPDSPNHPNFPSCCVPKNEEIVHLIRYRFLEKNESLV